MFAKKNHVFMLCWTTYVITYLCRVNFSSAMEKLSLGTGIDLAKLGVIGSVFFFSYALGQLVNGFLGDRTPPFVFISAAITATGFLNLLMSQMVSSLGLTFIWGLNGYIQSMLWGPMMRILSERFEPHERIKVSARMSSSMVAGFILSWAVFGKAFASLSWNWYFLVPAGAALAMGMFWIVSLIRAGFLSIRPLSPLSKKAAGSKVCPSGEEQVSFFSVFLGKRIWVIALACFCLGAIKESVSLWAPTLMTRMLSMDIHQSFLLISIIPVFNMGGILLSGILIRRTEGSVKKVLGFLFAGALGCALTLYFFYECSKYASVLLIASVSGIMYGCNTLLLSYIPISFSRYHMVSTLVGIFDFMSYLGAAMSSFCLGILVSAGSFRNIFLFWLTAGSCALAFAGFFKLEDC